MEDGRTLMKVGTRLVEVDLNDYQILPGDEALVVRGDGSLGVSRVKPAVYDGAFGGGRSALEPQDLPGVMASCVILGRVITTSAIPV